MPGMRQDVFAALADPTRREILSELRAGERAVGELVEAVGASQPTVSKHLRVLRESGLVVQRAAGQRRYYRIDAPRLRESAQRLLDLAPAGPEAPVCPDAAVAAEVTADAEVTVDPEMTVDPHVSLGAEAVPAADPVPVPTPVPSGPPATDEQSAAELQGTPDASPSPLDESVVARALDGRQVREPRPLSMGGLVSSVLRRRRR